MKKHLVTACLGCLFFANAFSQTSALSHTNALPSTNASSLANASFQTNASSSVNSLSYSNGSFQTNALSPSNVLSPTNASFPTNVSSPANASSSSNGSSKTDTSSPTKAPSHSAWKFRSVEYAGMLFGQAGNYGQLQTINGVYKGSWFLGAGLGLDFYRFRSIPVFLSVTKDLMPAKNGFFISLDAGTNFPWYKRPEGFYDGTFFTSKFVAGPFWTAGLGYKIKLSHHSDHALSLLGGYSYKKLREDAEDANNMPNTIRYNYGNKTWSLKIGLIL